MTQKLTPNSTKNLQSLSPQGFVRKYLATHIGGGLGFFYFLL